MDEQRVFPPDDFFRFMQGRLRSPYYAHQRWIGAYADQTIRRARPSAERGWRIWDCDPIVAYFESALELTVTEAASEDEHVLLSRLTEDYEAASGRSVRFNYIEGTQA